MFIIGGNQAVCPMGFICVNNYNLLLILVAVIICIYVVNKQIYLSVYNKMLEKKINGEDLKENNILDFGMTNPPSISLDKDSFDGYNYNNKQMGARINSPFNNPTRGNSSPNLIPNPNMNSNNGNSQMVDMDRVALNDRLYPPLSRNHYNDPNGMVRAAPQQMGMPINIETRGSGGDFQQVGILSKQNIDEDGKTPGNNTDTNILPLYGKPIYRGASKWIYYTETDKYNPVKIPITVGGRDCTDDQGCDELYDGSDVVIPSYNGVFKVKIYKFNKPRYIPIENPKEILPLPFT
jgi:hypothetical protein